MPIFVGFLGGGCASPEGAAVVDAEPAATTEDIYSIHIDRSTDEANSGYADQGATPTPVGGFAFQASAIGRHEAGTGTSEARAAAREAAIVEAFCRALIEQRRTAGESTSEFTERIGERLSVSHRRQGTSEKIEIQLVSRGVAEQIVVLDGVLQHPAHDFELIEQLFAESEGRLSLLSTSPTRSPGGFVANVACYQAGPSLQVAGGAPDAP